MRLQELGLKIGELQSGSLNSITDVPGVLVGQSTIVRDDLGTVRTGVTSIVPQEGKIWDEYLFAGASVLNGYGEMTGLAWIEETGLLGSPISLTGTTQVGLVRDALFQYAAKEGYENNFYLPVAAETDDSYLSDCEVQAISEKDVFLSIDEASKEVLEGSYGGGCGMIAFEFKGGTGTASRRVETAGETYTLGALVQANFGDRPDLLFDGIPVGKHLGYESLASPWDSRHSGGSILVVLATDAPLLPIQCKKLSRRAGLGLARVGSVGHSDSGDIFLSFSTGNVMPSGKPCYRGLKMLGDDRLNPLYYAVVEVVQEAIFNAMLQASDMTGLDGHTALGLRANDFKSIVQEYRKLPM